MGSGETRDRLLAELRASHGRLVDVLGKASPDQASYARDWTVAQVASHLGSGAQSFLLFLEAGLEDKPAPGVAEFQPIWDRWNAKASDEQVADCIHFDQSFLDAVASLSADQQRSWGLDMMGKRRDLVELLRMRLAEHALHTWDIAVAVDVNATVPSEAAGLVLDQLPMMVGFAAKPTMSITVAVRTIDPDRDFVLSLSPETSQLSSMGSGGQRPEEDMQLPAEAFVRLVYGRLDPDHTPTDVDASGRTLRALRAAFPGI